MAVGHKAAALGRLTCLLCTTAALVNRTIDDTYGDITTGTGVVYNVDLGWPRVWSALTAATQDNISNITFDASQMFMGTWHDGEVAQSVTQSKGMNISVSFTGVAVYVMFALPPSEPVAGVKHYTDAQFSLDGDLVQGSEFTYFSNQTQYNVPVFSKEGLENQLHHLIISPGSSFTPSDRFTYNLFEFDYVIYTQDTGASATSQGTQHPESLKIVAVVLGVMVGLLLISTAYLAWSQYRRRKSNVSATSPSQAPWSAAVNNMTVEPFLTRPPIIVTNNHVESQREGTDSKATSSLNTQQQSLQPPSADSSAELPNTQSTLLARMRRDLQSYEEATERLFNASSRGGTRSTSGGPLLNEIARLQQQMDHLARRVENINESSAPPEYRSPFIESRT